jgi:hypothetical protein
MEYMEVVSIVYKREKIMARNVWCCVYDDRFLIGQYVPSHGDVISHVNISSVRVEDGGTYQCTAFNRVGEASHSAQLNIYGMYNTIIIIE